MLIVSESNGINYHEFRMSFVQRLQEPQEFRGADNPKFPEHSLINPENCQCKLCSIQRKLVSTTAGDIGTGTGWLANELLNAFTFITMDTTDELFIYDEGVYIPRGEQIIKVVCQRVHQGISSYRINEIIRRIKRETMANREIFERSPHLLAVANGTLDLSNIENGEPEFRCHSSLDFLLTKLPVNYDPEATAPVFTEWLPQVAHPRDIPVIEEMFGFCLRRVYWLHKAIALLGETHSGKSTLLGIFKAFLGEKNVTGMTIQQLVENRFHAARLFGKLANLSADMPVKKLLDTGIFKAATGEDYLTVEKKGQDGFEFVNYAKFFFSANNLPFSENDRSNAFYSRFRIIRFDQCFTENKDTTLPARLTTPEELSGILNIALRGLRRLLIQNGFTNEPTLAESRLTYLRQSDPIGWIAEVLMEEDIHGWIEKSHFSKVYKVACDYAGLSPKSAKGVFKTLSNIYPAIQSNDRVRVGRQKFYIFRGVSFKNYLEVCDHVADMADLFCIEAKKRDDNPKVYEKSPPRQPRDRNSEIAKEIFKITVDTISRFYGQCIRTDELHRRLNLIFDSEDIKSVLSSKIEAGLLKVEAEHYMLGDES